MSSFNYFGTINSLIIQFGFYSSPLQQILTSSKVQPLSKKVKVKNEKVENQNNENKIDQNFNLKVDGRTFSLFRTFNLSSNSFSICSNFTPISRGPSYDNTQLIESIIDLYMVSLSTINSSINIKEFLQFFKQRIEKESISHHNHIHIHNHNEIQLTKNSTSPSQYHNDKLPSVAFFVNTFEEEETEDWKELERHKFWSLSREVHVLEEEKSKSNILKKSNKRSEMDKLKFYKKMLTPFSELEEYVHELFPSSMIVRYKYPYSISYSLPRSKGKKKENENQMKKEKKKRKKKEFQEEVQKIFRFVSEIIENVGVCEYTQRKKESLEKRIEIQTSYYSNPYSLFPQSFFPPQLYFQGSELHSHLHSQIQPKN